MAWASSWAAVGLAALAGAPAGAALVPPRLLSCEHQEEWVALSATLASLDGDDGATSALGLPRTCSRSDPALFYWALELVQVTWPVDANNFWPQYFLHCDPDLPEPRDPEVCDVERCFHGCIAAAACVAVMYANHPEEYVEASEVVQNRAMGVYVYLGSNLHALEFYDSSGWAFSTAELAAIVSTYKEAIGATSWERHLPLLESSRPWTRSSPRRRAEEEAAARSLALVASWSWPPRQRPVALGRLARASGEAPRPVRLWGFGTHCSVMAEPISAMRRLLAEEVDVRAVVRGGADYCGFHHERDEHRVRKDRGSAVREVYDRFKRKELGSGKSHRDWLADPEAFLSEFRAALAHEGEDFWASDVTLCSEPGLACLALFDAGKPVIGYLGVHIAFMVVGGEAQLSLYRRFRDELAADPRSTFATVAPYISMQMYYHTGVEVPAVRPLSMYTSPASYVGGASDDVLINRRPIAFWDLQVVLNKFSSSGGHPLRFIDGTELPALGRSQYTDWAKFRAAIYYPYDWLQTMAFYDFINIGLPTFVPDSPMYLLNTGTNLQSDWVASLWQPPAEVYPYDYRDRWMEGKCFWWAMTDFRALPGVSTFASVAELFETLLLEDVLWRLSAELRVSLLQRSAGAAQFWRSALLRAMQ